MLYLENERSLIKYVNVVHRNMSERRVMKRLCVVLLGMSHTPVDGEALGEAAMMSPAMPASSQNFNPNVAPPRGTDMANYPAAIRQAAGFRQANINPAHGKVSHVAVEQCCCGMHDSKNREFVECRKSECKMCC